MNQHSRQTALQLLSDACREAAAKFNFTPDQLELEQIYVGKGRSQKKLRVRTHVKSTVARHSTCHLACATSLLTSATVEQGANTVCMHCTQ
jgi:ribosomal protein L22